jgi:hypothetical protein
VVLVVQLLQQPIISALTQKRLKLSMKLLIHVGVAAKAAGQWNSISLLAESRMAKLQVKRSIAAGCLVWCYAYFKLCVLGRSDQAQHAAVVLFHMRAPNTGLQKH